MTGRHYSVSRHEPAGEQLQVRHYSTYSLPLQRNIFHSIQKQLWFINKGGYIRGFLGPSWVLIACPPLINSVFPFSLFRGNARCWPIRSAWNRGIRVTSGPRRRLIIYPKSVLRAEVLVGPGRRGVRVPRGARSVIVIMSTCEILTTGSCLQVLAFIKNIALVFV